MKTNWNILRAGALLFALPLMATAAVSASQWAGDNTAIELDIALPTADANLGVARAHSVAMTTNGAVEGRVASVNVKGANGIADLTVQFIRNGKVVAETMTSDDGAFRVEGLSEGNFSFVATGENGFAAYGVRVVEQAEGVHNVMEAAAVAPGIETVKQILDGNVQESGNTTVAGREPTTLVGANRVNLVDGTLTGSVSSLVGVQVEGTQVYILRGDEQIAETTTDSNGSFSVNSMTPGFYSFVATGPSGYAAVGFEAVEESLAEIEIPVSFSPAALQDFGFGSSLDVCTTCGGASSGEIVYDSAPVDFAPVEYAGEAIGCGGACGACSTCGGGGFAAAGGDGGGLLRGGIGRGRGRLFGGAGGFRRLALLGAAVAIPVALSGNSAGGGIDDDDAPPSSPTGGVVL